MIARPGDRPVRVLASASAEATADQTQKRLKI
jgi:hypothetical protein